MRWAFVALAALMRCERDKLSVGGSDVLWSRNIELTVPHELDDELASSTTFSDIKLLRRFSPTWKINDGGPG